LVVVGWKFPFLFPKVGWKFAGIAGLDVACGGYGIGSPMTKVARLESARN
jgi:hypothetical protein